MQPKKIRLALAFLIGGLTAGTLHAQTAPAPAAPPSPWAFNVALYSQYIFRGLSQTDYKPAIQGGIDFVHPGGFYAGVWASNINWLKDFDIHSGNVETDFYLGYKKSFGDVGLDVGYLRYEYFGSTNTGFTNPDTDELYIAGSYKWATLKYSHAISNAFGTADSKNTYYIDLTAAIPVADTWTLTLHVGHQKYKGPSAGPASYTDFKGEIAKDFGRGWSAGAGFTVTDADKDFYTPVGGRSIAKDTGYVFAKYVF
jgi:uncharacterized protein (TIGR02001 family)